MVSGRFVGLRACIPSAGDYSRKKLWKVVRLGGQHPAAAWRLGWVVQQGIRRRWRDKKIKVFDNVEGGVL